MGWPLTGPASTLIIVCHSPAHLQLRYCLSLPLMRRFWRDLRALRRNQRHDRCIVLRPVAQGIQHNDPHHSQGRCIWSALGSHKARRRVYPTFHKQRVIVVQAVQPLKDDLRKQGEQSGIDRLVYLARILDIPA